MKEYSCVLSSLRKKMSDSSDGELASSSGGEEDDFMIGKKTKRGKREAIYGAFAESEDDERDEGRRIRGGGGRRNDFSKPVGFTRSGAFHGKKGEEEEYEEKVHH